MIKNTDACENYNSIKVARYNYTQHTTSYETAKVSQMSYRESLTTMTGNKIIFECTIF